MKTRLLIYLLYTLFSCITQAQQYDCFSEYPSEAISLRSSRSGSAEAFYKNLNSWIPYGILTPDDPLKNPPIMEIEISFHIFSDNNGENNAYTNTTQGRNRLIWVFNLLNQIYAGFDEHEHNHGKGASDPIPGLVELPDCDTKIRFTLGNNNERIYFYNNSTMNALNSDISSSSSVFQSFIRNNFPDRSTKMNIYFSAGNYMGGASVSGYVPYTHDVVVICNSHKIANDWIAGMLLAHELGHTLNLVHTYCGGGASVVCCSGTCTQGCSVNTNQTDYLSDIFGTGTASTCPHIANWGDPFDNIIPNAAKITNNVMGGSSMARYNFSHASRANTSNIGFEFNPKICKKRNLFLYSIDN